MRVTNRKKPLEAVDQSVTFCFHAHCTSFCSQPFHAEGFFLTEPHMYGFGACLCFRPKNANKPTLALRSLVVELAIIQNLEGMPSRTCLIQGLCKASKPTEDLLCGWLSDKCFLEAQPVRLQGQSFECECAWKASTERYLICFSALSCCIRRTNEQARSTTNHFTWTFTWSSATNSKTD